MPATRCTCIAHVEVADGMGRWLVDVPDPDCDYHHEPVSRP